MNKLPNYNNIEILQKNIATTLQRHKTQIKKGKKYIKKEDYIKNPVSLMKPVLIDPLTSVLSVISVFIPIPH